MNFKLIPIFGGSLALALAGAMTPGTLLTGFYGRPLVDRRAWTAGTLRISADFLWFGFISFCVSRGQRFLTDHLYQWIIRLCALMLAGFSVWFLYTGGSYLLGVL